jgi:hypothetical protein
MMLHVKNNGDVSILFTPNTGEVVDGSNWSCWAGQTFGEYVKRALTEPFPYSSTHPASRKIDALWKERRLQILWKKNGAWRNGRVVSWIESNTDPSSRCTVWSLTVELDDLPESKDFADADRVQVQGLAQAVYYNGRSGRIVAPLNGEGRFPVLLEPLGDEVHGETPVTIGVKPGNLVMAKEWLVHVNRMNIEGGGTVHNKDCLISMEWLEPADPQIDLRDGSWRWTCPLCRNMETPPTAILDDVKNDPIEKDHEECPVCLELKQCRSLECGHPVCLKCWTDWTDGVGGFARSESEAEEIAIERPVRCRKIQELLPHFLGGVATNASSSEEIKAAAGWRSTDAFSELCSSFHNRMIDLSREGGPESLHTLYRELMVEHMTLFTGDHCKHLVCQLSSPSLDIYIHVEMVRFDELHAFYVKSNGKDKNKADLLIEYKERWCGLISERLEKDGKHLASIPWYEGMLHYAKLNGKPKGIAIAYCNLALAQKFCGLLAAAQTNYDQSLRTMILPHVGDNKAKLTVEMRDWIGTSGRITPGC